MRLLVVCALLLAGCHSSHSLGEPASMPIAAIGYDAVLVVNGGSDSITVVDATTHQVGGTIRLVNAPYPHHIYASPDRATVLVAAPGVDLSGGHSGGHAGHGAMGAVLKLEARTGALVRARRLDAMNHNASYSPDGSEIWTARMTTPGSVLVLDASTLATRQSIAVGSQPAEVTFSRDGRYAFAANGASNDVSVIDVAQKMVVKTIPVGAGPVGAWPGSDGVMYVDNETGKSVSAIDASTLAVVRTYDLGFVPAFALTAPNGELWVTDTDSGKLVFYASGSTNKTGELATGAGAHAIAFSADGKTAYVTNQQADTVSVVDVATHAAITSIATGAKPNGLLFLAR